MEANPKGMTSFLSVINSKENDRPTGSFPAYNTLDEALQRVLEPIQKFLVKYGEIMVEKEILAP